MSGAVLISGGSEISASSPCEAVRASTAPTADPARCTATCQGSPRDRAPSTSAAKRSPVPVYSPGHLGSVSRQRPESVTSSVVSVSRAALSLGAVVMITVRGPRARSCSAARNASASVTIGTPERYLNDTCQYCSEFTSVMSRVSLGVVQMTSTCQSVKVSYSASV